MAQKDKKALSEKQKNHIKENVKLPKGKKWNFYDPKTNPNGFTYGVQKGTEAHNKARYYGGKREKDIKYQAERQKKPEVKEYRKEYYKKPEQKEKGRKRYVKKRKEKIAYQKEYLKRPEAQEKLRERNLKRYREKGLFPPGKTYQENLWYDLYRASDKAPLDDFSKVNYTGESRFLLPQKYIDNAPRTKDGRIDWQKDGYYKKVKFYDTQTRKFIGLDSPNLKAKVPGVPLRINKDVVTMQKWLTDNVGKDAYKNAIAGYKEKDLIRQTTFNYQGKETKLGTLLRDLIGGVDQDVFSAFEVHHPYGVKNNWWTNQVVTRGANREINYLNRKLMTDMRAADTVEQKTKIINKYKKQIEKLPGGVNLFFEGQKLGIDPTRQSVVTGAAKTGGLRQQTINKMLNQLDNTFSSGPNLNMINKLYPEVGNFIREFGGDVGQLFKKFGASKMGKVFAAVGVPLEVGFVALDMQPGLTGDVEQIKRNFAESYGFIPGVSKAIGAKEYRQEMAEATDDPNILTFLSQFEKQKKYEDLVEKEKQLTEEINKSTLGGTIPASGINIQKQNELQLVQNELNKIETEEPVFKPSAEGILAAQDALYRMDLQRKERQRKIAQRKMPLYISPLLPLPDQLKPQTYQQAGEQLGASAVELFAPEIKSEQATLPYRFYYDEKNRPMIEKYVKDQMYPGDVGTFKQGGLASLDEYEDYGD